ncbi:hypothetical protein AOT14_23600 [Stenotrophomonas acidaminiphila]|uniref:Uncharacterized protein n=1 Tax=Stenotrophomonas acidaminiphila TaxID=128780 RepID=A0A0S1B0Z3_9GAMM|nr:hypothetical protein AOT14_23600 [Stenotrophomonas acidaminiphila]
MCIPGHSRDSVCLHCHPARLARSGTRQGIAPGNRCAEPCPTKRPQPRQEPWPLRPVADAAGIGKPGWRPPAPRAHPREPGTCTDAVLPAPPVNEAQRKRADAPARPQRRAEAGRPPASSTAGTANPEGLDEQDMRIDKHAARRVGRGPWAAHAPVAPGIRPGGTRLPGRPPNPGSTAPATRRPPRTWTGNSQRKTPGFPGVLATSREIPVSQYGGGGRN